MEKHQRFTEWAITRGVKINGLAAHRFPGKGLGIIAERRHVVGSTILTVPLSALRTASTVPRSVLEPIGVITVHGLLAAELSLTKSASIASWQAVLPSYEDFRESIPLMWDPVLQGLLPTACKSLLEHQEKKLDLDWTAVHQAFPGILYNDYIYNWLIVNTRTFHYTSNSRRIKKPTNPDDCMALNPFADYFNHTDTGGCEVSFGPDGYKIVTSRVIEKGDEVYISYGNHSNDFLLAEYGFMLTENKWDEMSLDAFIMPLLSAKQKNHLSEAGFLGKYILDRETVCYRTQVVLRLVCLPLEKWKHFVNGEDDGETDQPTVDRLLFQVLHSHLDQVKEMVKALGVLDCGLKSQRATLTQRWNQLHFLLETALGRIRPG